jgi:hypothetical protein
MRSRIAFQILLACVLTLIGLLEATLAREWTDTTGKFKIEAELVAVRNGKVILEKADGTVITVPLDKLSANDQAFLKAKESAAAAAAKTAANTAPAPTGASPAAGTPDPVLVTDPAQLAANVEKVLRASCYRCHGEEGASEGGFNFVLNLEKLAHTVVTPNNLRESLLYERISARDDSVMPPPGEKPRPTATDIAMIKGWIEAGAPVPAPAKPREWISNDAIIKYIVADVRQAPERSRRFLRFFTLTHLYNANVSEDELQTYRNAFIKLINSLSWNKNLVMPQPLDPARTVFRIDMRDLNWTTEAWEAIEKTNPYFLTLNSPEAKECNEATQSPMPYVRIDWFVFAASKPPLYHMVLQIPGTDTELEQLLRVNVEANIDQEKVMRAAFNRSGVSQNNRLIEWHASPYGSYWKSYDFGSNAGKQNLFEHPLGPSNRNDSFKQDGGEILFNLPNGMQGYMLVDGAGRRIDQGPTSIVSDPKQADRTVTNGVSCMSCHYTGVIPKTDEVGPVVRANPKAFTNSADILALYRKPEELNQVLAADARRFSDGMKQIGITSLSRSGEPISAMAYRFQEQIELPMAGAEFGLSPIEFAEKLDMAQSTARALAPLRVPGGAIKRDVFVTIFQQAAIEMRLTTEARHGGPAGARPGQVLASVVSIPQRTTTITDNSPRAPTGFGPPGFGPPGFPGVPGMPPASTITRTSTSSIRIESLVFSPSGNLLVAGCDKEIIVFDPVQATPLQTIGKLDLLGSVEKCVFTPSGGQLLAVGKNGPIFVFDVQKDGSFKQCGQFPGHSGAVKSISVSTDGKFAVSGGSEKKVRYWEIATGEEKAAFGGFTMNIKAVAMAKNGRTALATDGMVLQTLDLVRRDVLRTRKLSRGSGEAAFSPDGNYLAVGDGSRIHLYNLNSTTEMPGLQDADIVSSMAFTPDSNRLVTGGSGKINAWDFRKQRKIFTEALQSPGSVDAMAVTPDSTHVAALPMGIRRQVQIFRLPGADNK